MSQLLPPPPRFPVLAGDDDRRERMQFRLFQVLTATLTLMVAVWVTTHGVRTYGLPLMTIVTWVIAKHILVAILMMGLHRYPRYSGETEPPQTRG
jgi:hypothetical protein